MNPLQRLKAIKAEVKKSQEGEFHSLLTCSGDLVTRIAYPTILTFSDSFVLILPLNKIEKNSYLISLLSISFSILEIWKLCIDQGFTIRGGVDFGDIPFTNEDLIGPSLIKAYVAESKNAITSRVIYTSEALGLIRAGLESCQKEESDFFKSYFFKDIDGRIIINPVMIYGYNDSETEISNALDQLKEMKSKVKGKFDLEMKYEGLIARLNNPELAENDFSIYNSY